VPSHAELEGHYHSGISVAWSRTAPVADESARLPVVLRDLFHDLDLEVALGYQLLQPAVLLLQPAQPLDVRGLQLAELLPPRVDRGRWISSPLNLLNNRARVTNVKSLRVREA
jgi:hypothetical protein